MVKNDNKKSLRLKLLTYLENAKEDFFIKFRLYYRLFCPTRIFSI